MDHVRQDQRISQTTPLLCESNANTRVAFTLLTATLGASMFLPTPGHDGRIMHLPSVCVFYHATGLPCPACGLTRAFVCIGHGRLMDSIHWHPLGLLVYAVFILLWLESGVRLWKKHGLFPLSTKTLSRLFWSGLAVFLLVGFVRMAWLAGHHVSF